VDVVWYSEGRIDEKGYSVELRIPFKSIRFSHKEPVEMGVIFERRISRYSESGTYPPLDPDYGYNFLSQTRTLIFKDIKHYTLLEILPGVTYHKGSSMDEGKLRSDKGRGDISLTGKYGITSNLILDGTYNPDFSQVEADAGQVDFNLRYALYFPEKRPFFLEGLEKFYYGGYYQGDPLRAVVHTRTIVDPSWGFKLNGKIGDNNTIATIYAKDDLPDTEEDPHAYVGIFRYKRALAKDGFIGGFYTGRERQNGFNRVYGLDSQIRVNPSNLLGGHFFMSQTRSGMTEEFDRNEGHALGIHYLYHTRDWILMAGFQDIDKGFCTETGYMTRRGISRLRSEITRMFYPELKFLRRIDSTIHSFQTRDKFSGLYETDNSLGLRFTLLRNSSFRLSYQYSTEIFMSERFQTSGFSVMARNQFSKKFSLFVTYNYGEKIRYISDPFQGTGSDTSATITYLPTEKLHLNLRLAYSDFYRGYDSKKEFDYTIIRNRITYQVNKYLFFRAIVEYNSFRKELMTDFLASFTYIPGTVIHVGYGSLNEKIQWNGTEYRASHRFLETKRDFFFKASYLWRF